MATFDEVVRTQEEARLETMRNIFVTGVTVQGSSGPFKEIALDLAGRLSGVHLHVLRIIHPVRLHRPRPGRWDVNASYLSGCFRRSQLVTYALSASTWSRSA
jgi:hypothetical protein